MYKGRREEQKSLDKEPHFGLAECDRVSRFGVIIEANRKILTRKEEEGHQRIPQQLNTILDSIKAR